MCFDLGMRSNIHGAMDVCVESLFGVPLYHGNLLVDRLKKKKRGLYVGKGLRWHKTKDLIVIFRLKKGKA